MGGMNVLTYNVCFGCMLGSAEDVSAQRLALRCASSGDDPRWPNKCLRQAARNIDVAGECCGGLDIVGLQEAGSWRLLQERSRELFAKRAVVTKVGPEEIVLFVDRRFEVEWLGEGEVSGRPLQLLLLYDRMDDAPVLLVHLHNHHRDKGTTEVLLKSIASVPGLTETLSRAGADERLTVVCLGDWNDVAADRRGLRPFALCECPQFLRDLTVSAISVLPKSCCSTDTSGSKTMPFSGDYVMSNQRCWNGIPDLLLDEMHRNDASDHFAVLARVEGAAPHPLVSVLRGSCGWVEAL
jgi:hypothetical protein